MKGLLGSGWGVLPEANSIGPARSSLKIQLTDGNGEYDDKQTWWQRGEGLYLGQLKTVGNRSVVTPENIKTLTKKWISWNWIESDDIFAWIESGRQIRWWPIFKHETIGMMRWTSKHGVKSVLFFISCLYTLRRDASLQSYSFKLTWQITWIRKWSHSIHPSRDVRLTCFLLCVPNGTNFQQCVSIGTLSD